MSTCSIPVEPGDEVTWFDGEEEHHLRVEHVEEGTAHMCLIVGEDMSVWDWQVTHVNGVSVT